VIETTLASHHVHQENLRPTPQASSFIPTSTGLHLTFLPKLGATSRTKVPAVAGAAVDLLSWPLHQIGRVKVMFARSTRETRAVEHVVSSWNLFSFKDFPTTARTSLAILYSSRSDGINSRNLRGFALVQTTTAGPAVHLPIWTNSQPEYIQESMASFASEARTVEPEFL